MRTPSGPALIGDMPELRLEAWPQKYRRRALDDAILEGMHRGRNSPGLPALEMSLRGAGPGHMCRSATRPEALRGTAHGHPVDPGCASAFVRGYVARRDAACAGRLPNPTYPDRRLGICLAPLVEFALNAKYPSLVGPVIHVHGSLLYPSRPSSCFPFAPCTASPRSDNYESFAPWCRPFSGRRGEPSSAPGRQSKFQCSDFNLGTLMSRCCNIVLTINHIHPVISHAISPNLLVKPEANKKLQYLETCINNDYNRRSSNQCRIIHTMRE